MSLAEADKNRLVAAACHLITQRYCENRHHIAAAALGASGAIYTGLHLDTYVGRASVCAEAGALSAALSAGETGIQAIVSVRHPRPREDNKDIRIVSPCGICREMLCDFAPDADVLVIRQGVVIHVKPAALLPEKYKR